jgi:methyl-accepting chemotaxis protein
VTQQNTPNAEELSSWSEELASQAEQLREVMDFFTINSLHKKNLKGRSLKKQGARLMKKRNVKTKIDFNQDKEDSKFEDF